MRRREAARLALATTTAMLGLALFATPSSADTRLVKDINPGSGGSYPNELTDFAGKLYFPADDGTHGTELWTSDGTAAGTTLVSDINPGSAGSQPHELTIADAQGRDVLYFSANDGSHGAELWAYGVSGLVKDINPGSTGSSPDYLTASNDTLYFTADDGTNGDQLWTSDGTPADTAPVSSLPSDPSYLTDVDGTLYFSAYDSTDGFELWTSDGTSAGTRLVKDINPASSSQPRYLTNVNGTLYFVADDGTHGPELWKSNGVAATTTLVDDIYTGFDGSDPSDLVNVNGTLYFSATDSDVQGYGLWKSDGTAAGTVEVYDVYSPAPLTWLTNVNGTLFFVAADPVHGQELWKSDGTAGGTSLVKDINPGSGGSDPSDLTNINGTLYFSATDATHGSELWTSDGTAAGTTLVSDINPGSDGSDPSFLTNVDGTLYFDADDGTHGGELWSFRPTLTISRSGDGSGGVTSTASGIECGSDCSHDYAIADTVTLQATPTNDSTFSGWSGACSGTSPTCTVQMTADRSVTATFVAAPPTPPTLTVAGSGTGAGASPATPTVSLTGFRISPRKVSIAGRQTKHRCTRPTKHDSGGKHCRLAIKLHVSYTLNIPARVKITLRKQAPGRRVGGKCVKSTHKNREHRKCIRLVKVNGVLNRIGTAGINSFAWNGRVGARDLPPGTYTLIATPTANGHAGTSRRITLRILG